MLSVRYLWRFCKVCCLRLLGQKSAEQREKLKWALLYSNSPLPKLACSCSVWRGHKEEILRKNWGGGAGNSVQRSP